VRQPLFIHPCRPTVAKQQSFELLNRYGKTESRTTLCPSQSAAYGGGIRLLERGWQQTDAALDPG
jgi:hypothetical protein